MIPGINDENLIEAGEKKNKPPRIVCSLAKYSGFQIPLKSIFELRNPHH